MLGALSQGSGRNQMGNANPGRGVPMFRSADWNESLPGSEELTPVQDRVAFVMPDGLTQGAVKQTRKLSASRKLFSVRQPQSGGS